jgi:membrane protease YdiL (CAAX protease family)
VRNWIEIAAIVVVVGIAARFGFSPAHEGKPQYLLIIVLPTLLIAAYGLWRAVQDGVAKSWMSVKSGDFTRGFVGCAIFFFGAWAFVKLVTPVGSPREEWLAILYNQIGSAAMLRETTGRVVMVVAGLIVASIAEEVVWRGFVTMLLEEKVGSRRAWIYAAVLYAAAHVPVGFVLAGKKAGWNPILPLAALAGGLLWGAMARRYGRLAPSIFAHILFDWTVLMMFRLWGGI